MNSNDTPRNELDALLDEVARAEHERPLPDEATFLRDLHARIGGRQPVVVPAVPRRTPALGWSLAALALMALSLFLVAEFRDSDPGIEPRVDPIVTQSGDVDELVELLAAIDDLDPDDISDLLDTLELLEYWELLEDPTDVEILENS